MMMLIKIKLISDQVLELRGDPDELARAFSAAFRRSRMIKVHDPDGRTLAINPHQILFWEEIPDGQTRPALAAV
jgi:hypothetical protein